MEEKEHESHEREPGRITEREEHRIRERLHDARRKRETGLSARGAAIEYAAVFVAFLVISLVVFYPIASNMSSIAPGTGGDTYQNLWDIWWVGYSTFTLHTSMWHTGLLFPPLGANLEFQTMSPIGSLLSVPFQAIGLVFSYNTIFFLSFAVSGVAMFVLAEYLTRNRYAAFVAGLVFSFSAFHFMQALSHINWMFIAWVPLSLYFFLRILKGEGGLWSSVGLGISVVLTMFMGDIEQGIMLLELFILILIAYLLFHKTRKRVLSPRFWKYAIVSAAVAFVVGSFAFIPIMQALGSPGALSTINQLNTVQGSQLWSDNLLSFFLPNPLNSLFLGASSSYSHIYMGSISEEVSYVGYVVIALALYGIFKDTRRARLWIVIAIIFGWLALGPYVMVGTSQTAPGIYYAYRSIPFLNVIREPGRFDLIASMALAILASIGFAALAKGRSRGFAVVALAVVCVLFLAESTGIMNGTVAQATTTEVHVPQLYYGLAQTQGNFTVLNLPALPNQNSVYPALYQGKATFYTSVTRKGTVSGYVTRMNSTQQEYLFNIPLVVQAYNLQTKGTMAYSSPINESFTDQTLLTLYNYNVGMVAVDTGAFNQSGAALLNSYLTGVFGQPIVSNGTYAYGTATAINSTIFRSFVSYPMQGDWGSQYVLVNGSATTVWVPLTYGAVIVYAPYANTAGIRQKVLSGTVEPLNTTISLYAQYSGYPAKLYIEYLDQQGNTHRIAQLNLTGSMRRYTVNTTLYSGPRYPNTLFFTTGGATNSSYAMLYNITFRAR